MSIRQGVPPGTVVYQETHNTTTNAHGLANLQVGLGNILVGAFGPTRLEPRVVLPAERAGRERRKRLRGHGQHAVAERAVRVVRRQQHGRWQHAGRSL